MNKRCDTCIHYPICKTWTQADYRCGLYEAVPPCKVGDKLYIPIYDEIDDEGWCVDVLPINDVGQRFIYCPYSPSNENDVSDTFAIDRIGQDVFLSMDEAEAFIEAVKRGSKR